MILVVAAIGALLGPMVYFALYNLGGEPAEWGGVLEAEELILAYDRYNAPRDLLVSSLPDSVNMDCGYRDGDFLIGDSNPRIVLRPGLNADWTPATGYDDLLRWKSDIYWHLLRFTRGRVLADQLSGYSIRTLNDCISHTALAPICAAYVRGKLRPKRYENAWLSPPAFDQRRENITICRYLDGIAARAGKTLPARNVKEGAKY